MSFLTDTIIYLFQDYKGSFLAVITKLQSWNSGIFYVWYWLEPRKEMGRKFKHDQFFIEQRGQSI